MRQNLSIKLSETKSSKRKKVQYFYDIIKYSLFVIIISLKTLSVKLNEMKPKLKKKEYNALTSHYKLSHLISMSLS